MYPLVRELAVDGIPVTVTCRVLKIARQPYYRWLAQPVTDAEWVAGASGERACSTPTVRTSSSATGSWPTRPATTGQPMADRTAWRICSANGWWSRVRQEEGPRQEARKPGVPAHDDLVERDFTADAPNRLWLADITEHWTGEGKLYLCAIKDVWSNRIVGYSIDSRMKSRLAVAALDNAVGRRTVDGGEVAGCILHTDRGSRNFDQERCSAH